MGEKGKGPAPPQEGIELGNITDIGSTTTTGTGGGTTVDTPQPDGGEKGNMPSGGQAS